MPIARVSLAIFQATRVSIRSAFRILSRPRILAAGAFLLITALSLGVLSSVNEPASAQDGTPGAPLENVSNVIAEPGAVPGTVILQWDPVAGATAYFIYLETSRGAEGRYWQRVIDGALSQETITGLTGGVEYDFLILAASAAGKFRDTGQYSDDWSEKASATPNKVDRDTVLYNDHNHRVALVQYVPSYGDEIQIAISIGDPTNSLHQSTDIIKIKAESIMNVLDKHFGGDEWRIGNNFYSGTELLPNVRPDTRRTRYQAGDLFLKTDDCDIYRYDGSTWGETPVMAMQCD